MNNPTLLNPYKSRWYSAFKWMIGGNVAALLAFAIGLGASMVIGPFALLCFPVAALLPPAGFIYGFCRPTAYYDEPPRTTQKICVGIFWCLTTIPGFCAMCLSVILAFAFKPSTTLDFHHAGFAEVAVTMRGESNEGKLLRNLIPDTANDISTKGLLGGGWLPLGYNAQFSCTVSESDFRAFAKMHGYALAENDPACNANPKTGKSDWTSILPLSGKTLPASYWSYANIYSNGGGIYLLYDRTAHRLYGAYSSN